MSDIINNGKHIQTILQEACGKHKSPPGIPCWHIHRGTFSFGLGAAVCGLRIRKAGYVGEITPMSLQQKTPGGRSNWRKKSPTK